MYILVLTYLGLRKGVSHLILRFSGSASTWVGAVEAGPLSPARSDFEDRVNALSISGSSPVAPSSSLWRKVAV